jgi:predicted phage-related endonuclease
MTETAAPAAEQQNVGEIDRKTYIGGSDIAAIMGVGATYDGVQQTAYTVYLKKIGELSGTMDPDKKKFLERRKRWEEPIVAMLREEFKGEIVAVNARYIDPEHDFMAAEIDFEWRDSTGEIQNGEIKTVSPFAFGERHGWGEPGTSDIPVHYAAQVAWGQMIKGRKITILAAMVGIDNMLFYRLDRDDDTIATMRQAAVRFWHDHVLKRIPPEPQTLQDVVGQMLKQRGRPVNITGEIYDKVQRLASVNADMTRLAEEKEYLQFDIGDFVCKEWGAPNPYPPPAGTVIKKKVGNKVVAVDPLSDAGLYHEGIRVASWNKQRGSYLDQNRLKAEHPQIASELMIDHFFRVLRHHKPK